MSGFVCVLESAYAVAEIFYQQCIESSSQRDAFLQELQERLEKEQTENSRLALELSQKTEVSSLNWVVCQ